jgi:sodium transport system permease protein
MRFIGAIFRKELRESLRDWKALIVSYGMPLVVYPVLFVWMAEAVSVRMEKEKDEKHVVARIGLAYADVDRVIAELPQLQAHPLDAKASAELLALTEKWIAAKEKDPLQLGLRDLLAKSGIHLLLHVEKGGTQAGTRVRVLYDPTRAGSGRAARKLTRKFTEVGRMLAHAELKRLGLTVASINPLESEEAELSGPIRSAVPLFGPVLLSLIMLVLCLAAYYPALNSTVAERESGTLHTLLSTPTLPRELVLGKFLAVWLASLLGLASYSLPALVLYRLTQAKGGGMTESLPLHELPWLVLAGVALSFLISSISIALGFLARRQSEAQAMLSILLLSAMLPSVFVTSSNIELGFGASLVPLVNLTVLSKTLFVQEIGAVKWLLSIASNLIAGVLMLFFAAHLLENETRGETAFVRWRKAGSGWLREPTADLSLLYYAGALALGFYGSLALAGVGIWASLFVPQLLLFLAAPFFLARALGLSREETFLMRKPSARALVGAALVALPLAAAMGALSTQIRIPQQMLDELQKQFGLVGSGSMVLGIAAALLPAVCEEFAFRGLILSGLLRRFSPQIAILASALMFAFMHVSLIRFVPTFLVGLVLGSIAFRTRSIWPGMMTHGVYNLALVLLARFT